MPHAADAYQWAYGEIALYCELPFDKQATLNYVANTEDISAILPADLYLPNTLEYRQSTAEEWVEVDRKDSPLPSREQQPSDRVIEWTWRTRTIIVNKASANGLLRLSYLGLLSDPTAAGNPVLMDNLVTALGFATAAIAYARRGQTKQSDVMMGTNDSGGKPRLGALGMMDQITTKLVQNMQNVARRGGRFSNARTY